MAIISGGSAWGKSGSCRFVNWPGHSKLFGQRTPRCGEGSPGARVLFALISFRVLVLAGGRQDGLGALEWKYHRDTSFITSLWCTDT